MGTDQRRSSCDAELEDGLISAALSHETLEQNVRYEAVSYDWGAVVDSEGILIDEQHFLVTSTLLAALCALRYGDAARVLCVDDT